MWSREGWSGGWGCGLEEGGVWSREGWSGGWGCGLERGWSGGRGCGLEGGEWSGGRAVVWREGLEGGAVV